MPTLQIIVFIFPNMPSLVSINKITFLQMGRLSGPMKDIKVHSVIRTIVTSEIANIFSTCVKHANSYFALCKTRTISAHSNHPSKFLIIFSCFWGRGIMQINTPCNKMLILL